jgi:hypothetical protein
LQLISVAERRVEPEVLQGHSVNPHQKSLSMPCEEPSEAVGVAEVVVRVELNPNSKSKR